MEKLKNKSIKRKKRKKPSIWQQTLKKDLQLTEIHLYQETFHVNMITTAFELEKRRNPNPDYVR
ncbi:hypothetical protein MUP77_17225 [Candidatus Bathyarchaeota archaeon]|nr:hypothetical protein [Candidatus Bathyarchaeota archaeon]